MQTKTRGGMTVRVTWRLIALTTLMAVLLWMASLLMLRAIAQEASPPPTEVGSRGSENPTGNEEQTERRAASPQTEVSPEFRESADNNISFPIDI
jgi:hypothetical protein